MRHLNRCLLPLLLCLPVAGAVRAEDGNARCEKVRAVIVDTQVTTSCTSPNDFCSAGTVRGDHGLNGTTFFSVDSAINGPPTAPGTIAASGILVYTTRRGTLTVRESGLTSGNFISNFQTVLSGTGDFAGVTGHMWVNGELVDGSFHSAIRGELCQP